MLYQVDIVPNCWAQVVFFVCKSYRVQRELKINVSNIVPLYKIIHIEMYAIIINIMWPLAISKKTFNVVVGVFIYIKKK